MIAALAALAALVARGEEHGSGGTAGATFEYRLDGPEWVDPALLAAAVALGLAAMMLWAARRPLAVIVALVLLPVAVGGGVLTVLVKRDSGRISRGEAKAAGGENTESGVRRLLGAPAGHGTMTTPAGRPDCLLYVGDRPDRTGVPPRHWFCFRDGRLVARRSW